MALFTKIFILALCAIAAECTFPILGSLGHFMGGLLPGMMGGGRYGMMGGGMYPGMMGGGMYPGMMGGGMYPGMMGYKEKEESSDKPSESPTPNSLPSSPSVAPPNDNPKPWEITKAFGDMAEQIRKDHPDLVHEQDH